MIFTPFKSYLMAFIFFLSAILLGIFLKSQMGELNIIYMILKDLGIVFLVIGIILQIKLKKSKK
ncbi:hypothetical protein [Methanococcus maripaludis]|uniref:Preprotein translocase subunit SecG n=1 Tax=Methanococcus maripaludis TaxID=39152 RepID=A0A7J9PFD5_METMI|nr:hypothetical protein [Methanococcus maripaludis]MBA2861851.1 preprotein translocase subunit SecG [Methanococcus maripaludis]